MVSTGLLIQRVEEIVRLVRIQRGGDAVQTGVGDRPGGQPLPRIGVIRAVDLCLLVGQGAGDAAERIYNRGVDVQIGIIRRTAAIYSSS